MTPRQSSFLRNRKSLSIRWSRKTTPWWQSILRLKECQNFVRKRFTDASSPRLPKKIMRRTQLKKTKPKNWILRTEMSSLLKHNVKSSSKKRRRSSIEKTFWWEISTPKEPKFKAFSKKNCRRRSGKKLTNLNTRSYTLTPKSPFPKKTLISCVRRGARWNGPCVKPRSKRKSPKRPWKLQRKKQGAIAYGLLLRVASGTRICSVIRPQSARMANSSRILARSWKLRESWGYS